MPADAVATVPLHCKHGADTMERTCEFRTERLQLAIFLHATGRLTFLGCQSKGNGKVRFAFDDPQQAGAQQELEFERGAPVSATALFASQKFLRRQMTDALNRKIGVSEHGYER